MPTSLTETAGSFNATNNALDDYRTNCTDRWKHIKAPLQGRRRYQRKTLTSQSQSQQLESNATYIKPPTLPTQGTAITDTLEGYWLPFCHFVSFYNTLSHSDFGIGGVVADTTLMTALTEAVSSFIQVSKREFGLVWTRSIRLTKSCFIRQDSFSNPLSLKKYFIDWVNFHPLLISISRYHT